MIQEDDPVGTKFVDTCNGFNKLVRLTIIWNVKHCWLSGEHFAFNFYKTWEQLLL